MNIQPLDLLHISLLKCFWKISYIYYISFLRYLQSLKSTSQIPINFLAELGKIELLVTFNREIISTVIYRHKQ